MTCSLHVLGCGCAGVVLQSEVLEIVADLESVTGLHLTFGVRTPHRTYWFQACSTRDRTRWVDALLAFAPPATTTMAAMAAATSPSRALSLSS